MKTARRKMETTRNRPKSPSRRAKPGAGGEGEFYHVEVRPSREFKTFRTQDVGRPGGIERVAGKRSNGSWATQKWLISKRLAHVEEGRLVADSTPARDVLNDLGSAAVQVRGNRFKVSSKRNASEAEKPTPGPRGARRLNVIKAEAIALSRS